MKVTESTLQHYIIVHHVCVFPLNSGHRVNKVMWLRNSFIRNQICPMCFKPPDLETVPEGWGDGFTVNQVT